jgi:hypothetical protein
VHFLPKLSKSPFGAGRRSAGMSVREHEDSLDDDKVSSASCVCANPLSGLIDAPRVAGQPAFTYLCCQELGWPSNIVAQHPEHSSQQLTLPANPF